MFLFTNLDRRASRVVLAALMLTAFSVAQDPGSTGVSVTTWQNDTHRTGRNLNEGVLVSPLTGINFGQLCNAQLDGQVYAQPLVETSVTINGTHYPGGVAYIVTQNDTLYAINGTPTVGNSTCPVITSLPLLPILTTVTGQTNTAVVCNTFGDGKCGAVNPVIGILGTPVINVSNHVGTIYLVTHSQDSAGNYYHYLHAIDIQHFTEESGGPFRIGPPGGNASNFSKEHIQRPGLLFANGYVYVAFSMIDGYGYPYPNGTVFGYSTASLAATPLYFQTSVGLHNSSNGGGIWQGGAAPAYGSDSTGTNYIYLKTANGTFDGTSNWGDSLLKLLPTSTTLTVPSGGYFAPADQYYRSTSTCTSGYQGASPQPGDMDFGSGGVMLIPDTDLASWPYLAVSGDKEGGIWFNDRTAPATPPHQTSCDPSNCSCSVADGVVQAYWTSTPNYGQVIHNSPAYWRGGGTSYLYVGPSNWGVRGLQGNLVRYPLCSTANSQFPIDTTCGAAEMAVDPSPSAVSFPFGVTPTVSAASTSASDAIIWALWDDGSALGSTKVAVLYAFDAADTTGQGKLQQLYVSSGNGNTCASDAMTAPATKFSLPSVANGYVYVATQGAVGGSNNSGMFFFGPNRTCQ
jgi:hypothetical protein